MKRRHLISSIVLTAAIASAATLIVVRSRAAGIPAPPGTLNYTGYLENPDGSPVESQVNIDVQLYDDPVAGNKVCENTVSLTPVSGRFEVDLDMCTAAVKTNPDLYVAVRVGGTEVSRAKIGAVPYAVEADRATSADNAAAGSNLAAELDQLMPPKSIVATYLTGPEISARFSGTGLGNADTAYEGWAICNGNNGTPNLAGRFLRFNATAAGATGGSDTSPHTHGIDHDHASFTSGSESGHTHPTPNHQHVLPFGYDGSAFYYAVDASLTPIFGSTVGTMDRATPGFYATGNGATRLGFTADDGGSTTGASSGHNHSIDVPALSATSGAASATENRPAYFELVALMRL